METWTESQLASIHSMLNPRSIAIIGATPRLQYGGRFLQRVLKFKDRVKIYAVNPKHQEIFGEKSYPTIADLPEAPELAVVIVPYHAVLDTLTECHKRGTRSAIVISAGFAERGEPERKALQEKIAAFARSSGIRFSGPNCLGLANIRDDIWLTSSGRVESGNPGNVGMICQSGASLFGPFLARALDVNIGLSYAVSTGNEADLEFADFARYMIEDPGTQVIAGFVEGFKNASKTIEVAKLAAERGKPLVVVKIGRSALGARAANSHTAALTGSDELYDAAFRQYGVIRVDNYDDLLETAQLLSKSRRPSAKGMAVVSHSGGVSSLTADMCGREGLVLPPLNDKARDGINGILKGFGWADNPADVTGRANSGEFPAIMDYLIEQPEVGTLVVASAGRDEHVEQVVSLRDRTDKDVVYMWTGSRLAEAGLPELKKAGLPVFYNPDSLARAMRRVQDYFSWQEQRKTVKSTAVPALSAEQADILTRSSALGRHVLSEFESKAIIRAWGISTTREARVHSADEAVAAASSFGYPVVVKVDSPDIPHKTEANAVRLSLADAASVKAAYEDVLACARKYKPDASIGGVLVQEMVKGGTETIVGLTYDSQLGPTLLFGAGGSMVEVYKDVALRLCPISHDQALEMIAEVKAAQLLNGFRGRPRGDVQALAKVLVEVSQMGAQLEGKLSELDINPLVVLPEGRGVVALDSLIFMQPK